MLDRARKAVTGRIQRYSPHRVRLRRRVRRALHGRTSSILSSNCVGGRISELAGDEYLSPTVGLLFEPASFVEFVSDLDRYLHEEIVEDPVESRRLGFPVGRMGDVTIKFMHYASFAEAVATWRRRADRVRLDDVALVYIDGGDEAANARFADLPTDRKVMITSRMDRPESYAVVVEAAPTANGIGDLYTDWERLEPLFTAERLAMFRSGDPAIP